MFPCHAVAQDTGLYAFTGFRVNIRPVGISELNTDESPSAVS